MCLARKACGNWLPMRGVHGLQFLKTGSIRNLYITHSMSDSARYYEISFHEPHGFYGLWLIIESSLMCRELISCQMIYRCSTHLFSTSQQKLQWYAYRISNQVLFLKKNCSLTNDRAWILNFGFSSNLFLRHSRVVYIDLISEIIGLTHYSWNFSGKNCR